MNTMQPPPLGGRMIPAVLVAALAGLGALGLNLESALGTKAGPTTVPFELLESNHMAVEATLNGKGPYRFVFDLGAPVTLLGNRAAESSGTIEKGAFKFLGMPVPGEAKVGRLEIGAIKAEGAPVVVFEHPVLKALAEMTGRPLDGILGFTFFAHYKTTIDYQARRLTLEPIDYAPVDLMASLPDRIANPKSSREVVLAPLGLWGLSLARPATAVALGPIVASVAPGSPADRAGIKAGDVLTTLDGRWTTTVDDAYAAAALSPAGKAVDAVVVRDGREMIVSVTPAAGF